MIYHVEVTWEDKVDGEAGRPTRCAISQAIMRLHPHALDVRTNATNIALSDSRDDTRYWFHTPVEAAEWLIAFDGKTETAELEAMPDLSFDLGEPYRSAPIRHGNSRSSKRRVKIGQPEARPTRRYSRDSRGNSVLVKV